MSALTVWRDTRRVGRLDLTPNGDVRFTYDPDVVAEGRMLHAVGLRCPVRARPWVGADAAAIFENLLPEGSLRDALGLATKHLAPTWSTAYRRPLCRPPQERRACDST